MDVNVYRKRLPHEDDAERLKLVNYLFGVKEAELSPQETKVVTQRLKHEMSEIFYGTNIVRVS